MTERIRWFKDISKDDVEMVGGKGANLGEMTNAISYGSIVIE